MEIILGQSFDRKTWELRTHIRNGSTGDEDNLLVLRVWNHSGEERCRFFVVDMGDWIEVLTDEDFAENVQAVIENENVTEQEAHDKVWGRRRPIRYFTHAIGLCITEPMEALLRRWASLNDLFHLEILF